MCCCGLRRIKHIGAHSYGKVVNFRVVTWVSLVHHIMPPLIMFPQQYRISACDENIYCNRIQFLLIISSLFIIYSKTTTKNLTLMHGQSPMLAFLCAFFTPEWWYMYKSLRKRWRGDEDADKGQGRRSHQRHAPPVSLRIINVIDGQNKVWFVQREKSKPITKSSSRLSTLFVNIKMSRLIIEKS